MNGQAARSSRREKSRRHDDDSQASSQDEDEEEKEELGDHAGHRFLKRKTARAAINKMKLLDASDEDYEEEEKEAKKLKRSSGSRLRQTPRISKRTAVIQSDSDSEDVSSAQGRRSF